MRLLVWCRTKMSILLNEGDRIFTGAGGHSARGWGPLGRGRRGAGH